MGRLLEERGAELVDASRDERGDVLDIDAGVGRASSLIATSRGSCISISS